MSQISPAKPSDSEPCSPPRPSASRRRAPVRTVIDPDLVLLNGRVLTIDPDQTTAEAFAVKNGKFIAIGTSADMRSLATRNTTIIDAGRLTVTPGFIDAHCHPGEIEELYDVSADLRSIQEIQQALRNRAQDTPPGHRVRAFKFDDTKLTDGRALSRKDLDAAVPDHPARVDHRGGQRPGSTARHSSSPASPERLPTRRMAATTGTRTATCRDRSPKTRATSSSGSGCASNSRTSSSVSAARPRWRTCRSG